MYIYVYVSISKVSCIKLKDREALQNLLWKSCVAWILAAVSLHSFQEIVSIFFYQILYYINNLLKYYIIIQSFISDFSFDYNLLQY